VRQEKPISSGFYEFIRGDESWIGWVYVRPDGAACVLRRGELGSVPIDDSFLRRYEWIGPIETPEGVPEGISSW